MSQRFCDNCGAKLSPGATFCDNCGHKIENASSLESSKETHTTKNSSGLICSNCGAKIDPGSKFCDNCGHKTDDSDIESNKSMTRITSNINKEVKREKRLGRSVKIALVAIIIIVGGFIIGFKSGFIQEQYIKQSASSSGLGSITDVDINLNKKTAYFVLTDDGEKEYKKELEKSISADDPDEHLPMENMTGKVVEDIIKQQRILGSDWTVSVSTRQPNNMLICFRNGKETFRFQDTEEYQELVDDYQERQAGKEIFRIFGGLKRSFDDGYNNE